MEIAQLSDTLNYAVTELAKTDDLRKELIANVSHDLRTPLTMIRAYSEVMRDVDLAVSTAHAGGVDPETSRSTVEMRSAIIQCSLELFRLKKCPVWKRPMRHRRKAGAVIRSIWAAESSTRWEMPWYLWCPSNLPAPGTDLPSLCGRRSEDGGDPVKDPTVCRR